MPDWHQEPNKSSSSNLLIIHILIINIEKYLSTYYIHIKIIYIFAVKISVQKENIKQAPEMIIKTANILYNL